MTGSMRRVGAIAQDAPGTRGLMLSSGSSASGTGAALVVHLWQQQSAIAGLSFWRFCFRFFRGITCGLQVVEFRENLRAQMHDSRLVRQWLDGQPGAVQIEFLPDYAPELNPFEQT